MDRFKIAFILCVTDDVEFNEALHYIEALHVPEGYETDVIAVREAPSMTAGYNAAMNSSDAKYKIYIHQDVFLIYKYLLDDLIALFLADETIGMVGTIGSRLLPRNASAISCWDTGRVLCNGEPCYYRRYQDDEKCTPVDVMAIDGMFMATQYDITWREDLFDDWHFYDISQSAEFLRQGKRVVVPYQKEYWTFHDNKALNLRVFDEYRYRFIDEYQDIYPFQRGEESFKERRQYEKLKVQTKSLMQQLVDKGQMKEVCLLMENPQNQGHPILQELELICRIYSVELEQRVKRYIYEEGMSYETVYNRFRTLRYLVKRIEFEEGIEVEVLSMLMEEYSIYAVLFMLKYYVINALGVYEIILLQYEAHDYEQYMEFQKYRKLLEDVDIRKKNTLELKINVVLKKKDRLVFVKKMGEEYFAKLLQSYDEEGTVIFVEEYMLEQLETVQHANVLTGNLVKLVEVYQDTLYKEYKQIVVFGRDMEEYIKLYHNTRIPVQWFIEDETALGYEYSENIEICRQNSFVGE